MVSVCSTTATPTAYSSVSLNTAVLPGRGDAIESRLCVLTVKPGLAYSVWLSPQNDNLVLLTPEAQARRRRRTARHCAYLSVNVAERPASTKYAGIWAAT